MKLHGKEHVMTLRGANNYADSLMHLKHFDEAKALLRKMIPVARRVLGENHETTLRMRKVYAITLYKDPNSTRDDLCMAVGALQELERTAQRVLGSAQPLVGDIRFVLRDARAALAAREPPPSGSA